MPIFAQPLWGILCDRIGSIRKVFVFCLGACALLIPLLTMIESDIMYLIIFSVVSIFICPFFALMDAWTIQGIKIMPGNKTYGSVRMWGTIGFIPTTLLFGKISAAFSVSVLFWIFSGLCIVTIVVASCIPFSGVPAKKKTEKNENSKELNPVLLLKNYKYVSFVICYCLLNIATIAMFSYMPQRVTYAGGDSWTYSLILSLGAIGEIPMYLLSSRGMRKIRPQNLMIFSMLLTALHLLLISMDIPAWSLIPIQMLRGAAYSLCIMGNVYYIDQLAPDGLKTSAQSIANTVSGAIAGVLGAAIGGFFLGISGILGMLRLCAILSIISLVIFVLTLSTGYIKQKIDDVRNYRRYR